MAEMEQIQHKQVNARGLKLHVAEIGDGPKVVLFLHGFPEIWYSWRHQMLAVADAGYRAIAFDFRGFGLSDQPPQLQDMCFKDLIDDILALLDSFGISKAFVVGKDLGAFPAVQLAVAHPERVSGVVTLGVQFMLAGPSSFHPHLFPEGFYMLRWKEPGRAEADFGRFDVRTVIRNIYILFSGSEVPIAGENQEIMDLVHPSTPLPPWFTENDLTVYTRLCENSGFAAPLQVAYRKEEVDCGIKDPKVSAPGLFIMGEKDYVLKFPETEEYIKSEKMKEFAPDLEITFIPEGNHFVQEQFPEQVNKLIISFLNKHT